MGLRARVAALGRRSREREAVVQAAKAALAAVLALLVAQPVVAAAGGGPAFLAPYAAVLAVTTTVRRSWTGAARQAAGVSAGVLLAAVVALASPGTAAGLAVVVVVGLLLGRWRRLGPEGDQIAVTAVILLVGGAAERPTDLALWVLLSLTGSVLGAAVNTLVAPPLHLLDAQDAVAALAADVTGLLRDVARGVREGWDAGTAASWVDRARGTRLAVRRAADAVGTGRESARWNPRRRGIARSSSPLTAPAVVQRLDRLAERAVQVAVLLADLADLAGDGDRPRDPALADLVDRVAGAVEALHDRYAVDDDTVDDATDELRGPAEAVRALRADAADEPARVRSAVLLTLSDAVGDLAAPRP